MKNRKALIWQAIIPAALMVVGQLETAAPAMAQSQPPRGLYADGVYTAKGQYGGQPSSIVVTVTLRNGVVADVRVEPQATVPRSLELQRSFAAAVPAQVVGKPIDQVRVGKLAGSSGTPRGFNDAIRKIKRQAGN